jgi:hypothetical protein
MEKPVGRPLSIQLPPMTIPPTSFSSRLRPLPIKVGVRHRPPDPQVCHPVGKSEMDGAADKTITFCSYIMTDSEPIVRSKDFDQKRPSDFKDLFIAKCQECCKRVDLSPADSERRSLKLLLFGQIASAFESPILVRKLDQACVQAFVNMIVQNLLRELPFLPIVPVVFLFDRRESFSDLAWPMIEPVYRLFYTLIASPHMSPNVLLPVISADTLQNLFHFFKSPDVREREQVKMALSAIAGRLPDRTYMILALISKAWIDASVDEPIRIGLPQIFELFTEIVRSGTSSFGMSLRQMLPLYLSSEYPLFAKQLTAVVVMLQERDPTHVDVCIRYLLNHFPCASQNKQVLFLEEIRAIVVRAWQWIDPRTSLMLFERISMLFSSECAEIARLAIDLILSEGFRHVLKHFYATTSPTLLARANTASTNHWDACAAFSAFALIQGLAGLDPHTFAKIKGENLPDDDNDHSRDVWNLLRGMFRLGPAPPMGAKALTMQSCRRRSANAIRWTTLASVVAPNGPPARRRSLQSVASA